MNFDFNTILTKDFILHAINSSKTKGEFITKMQINTQHKSGSYINNELQKILNYVGIDVDISSKAFIERYNNKLKEEYYINPKYCKKCGNIIPFEKRGNSYCSQSCANSISNVKRGGHTLETKEKISNAFKNKKLSDTNYITYRDALNQKLIVYGGNINDSILDNFTTKDKIKKYTKICKICGKQIIPHLLKDGSFSESNTCSYECHKQLISQNSKELYKKLKDEGRFQGWQSRNILSYAENFWIKVLKNNNIEYIPNKPIKQPNGISNYFLDFYIEKNGKMVDLEIDGKQHEYKERKESDVKRDEYIKSLGMIVYRIKWNKIISEEGKQEMKNKIDKFLEFYNSL